MSVEHRRKCPICNGLPGQASFPYSTLYNNNHFDYIKCKECNSVYVDPIPDSETFSLMYDKSNYHDKHYQDCDLAEYKTSVKLLKIYIKDGSTVLDYGCGLGLFLNTLKGEGLKPIGVEFDKSAADFVHKKSKCRVFTIDEFEENISKNVYDCVHFGDVLEHLPNPGQVLEDALKQLKREGVLFVEGPLEINPSLVYYSAVVYGFIKNLFGRNKYTSHAPTHLFRTGAKQQLDFFIKNKNLKLVYWNVYETGWPYAQGGVIKRIISKLAIALGGKVFFGLTFGNRFKGIFIYSSSEKNKK